MSAFFQLLLHLLGDYLFQNDWQAANKTKMSWVGYAACFIHCILYTALFAIMLNSWYAIAAIFLSHFLIDKYRLAILWVRLKNWNWYGSNYGFASDKPAWLSTWLLIIIDNTLHIMCNYFAITYL